MSRPTMAGRRARAVSRSPRRQDSRHGTLHRELQSRLEHLQQDYADLHAALFEGVRVHRRLCAPRLIQVGHAEIASEVFAVRYLPGDFFTAEHVDGGVILALGDVCGKGVAAGMWTPCLIGLVRAHAAASSSPEAIVSAVNAEFCRMMAPLASMVVMRLDPGSGALDYCSAGHPPMLLQRGHGDLEWLSVGGTLLGISPGAAFASGHVDLQAGDTLLAYSDGVVEAHDGVDEPFGGERLAAELRRADDCPADALLFSVLAAVQDFVAPHALADDTSLAVVRYARPR